MLYSKILVAYDGSELAEKSLQTAIGMAKKDDKISIDVLGVVAPLTNYVSYDYIPTAEIIEESLKMTAQSLEKVKNQLSEAAVKHNTFVKKGNPAATILEQAKENGNDLIIMGSRGLSGVKEFFLGSVSHNVVQHSPIPVLVVK